MQTVQGPTSEEAGGLLWEAPPQAQPGQGPRDSGVQEPVEGIVGRLQVKEHLAHLGVVQLVRCRHAAQRLQPVGHRDRREGRSSSRGQKGQGCGPSGTHSPLADRLAALKVRGQVAHTVHGLHQLPQVRLDLQK